MIKNYQDKKQTDLQYINTPKGEESSDDTNYV